MVVLTRRAVYKWASAACLVLVVLGSWPAAANGGFMDQFERRVGAGAVPELVKAYGGEYELPVWERQWLDEIFHRLVSVTSRKDVIPYSLTVLNSPELNAFALPGGFVFITRGLFRHLQGNPHMLAAVLGHELAHVELKHGINSVLRQLGMTVLVEVGVIWLDLANAEVVRVASATLLQLLRLGWGREAEYEADILGQKLAAAAGFDPAGAVMLMDYLLSIESDEHPADIFSTHPPSAQRRTRLSQELANFWSNPVKLDESTITKVLRDGRKCEPDPRKDLMGRFTVELRPGANGNTALVVHDSQLGEERKWLGDQHVREAAWSPNGQYLAVIVDEVYSQGVWLLDRYGRVAHKWRDHSGGELSCLQWDPAGERLVYVLHDGRSAKLVVGYVPERADVVIYSGDAVEEVFWWEDGSSVAFYDGIQWHLVRGPQTAPVVVVNPVPRVLERRSFLSPTIERDGDTIRLTRPQLAIP